MEKDELVQQLLDNYLYQKEEAYKKAGGRRAIDMDRAAAVNRPRMEKLAEVVGHWDVSPDVLMDAVFAYSRSNRHYDGPMPNMLLSAKYLTKALAFYLQVPTDAIVDRRFKEIFLERMDYDYEEKKKELEDAGVTDLLSVTSYPVEIRYVMALGKLDTKTMFYLSQELLQRMGDDKRVKMWMDHRGVSYDQVAKFFNSRRKKLENK